MKLRPAYLIQAAFATVVAVSLSFGASQVFAAPQAAGFCPTTGEDYQYSPCDYMCGWNQGYCSASGVCYCG